MGWTGETEPSSQQRFTRFKWHGRPFQLVETGTVNWRGTNDRVRVEMKGALRTCMPVHRNSGYKLEARHWRRPIAHSQLSNPKSNWRGVWWIWNVAEGRKWRARRGTGDNLGLTEEGDFSVGGLLQGPRHSSLTRPFDCNWLRSILTASSAAGVDFIKGSSDPISEMALGIHSVVSDFRGWKTSEASFCHCGVQLSISSPAVSVDSSSSATIIKARNRVSISDLEAGVPCDKCSRSA